MAQITTKECLKRGCIQLRKYVFFGRATRLCNVTGRIPGNMDRCPMDPEEEMTQ